jgi:lipoate-protein ligase A
MSDPVGGPDVDPHPDLAELEWRLVREEIHEGPAAMAYDEMAAETVADGGPATVRVYQWLPPTLSLGYRQDPDTVDWAFCEEHGIQVTRRPTGGGAIYHDTYGDVSYSIIAPADALPGDLTESYEVLCEPVLRAFRELGIDADYADEPAPALYEPACYLRATDPAHDVVAPDGRKISGNAQYRTRDAVVQHGSLSFEARPERHLSCFADPPVSPEEFGERVTSIREHGGSPYDGPPGVEGRQVNPWQSFDFQREAAVRALEESLTAFVDAEEGEWTDAEEERAAQIENRKYRTDAWNRDREDPLD